LKLLSCHPDGGLEWFDCTRAGKRRVLLPCENDQAKPDPFSRLARSTNLSKILASIRLSGLVGSRPKLLRRGVLELVAHNDLCISVHISPFLREPFKHIEVPFLCQAPIFLIPRRGA
jgi:hypothetical protein